MLKNNEVKLINEQLNRTCTDMWYKYNKHRKGTEMLNFGQTLDGRVVFLLSSEDC